MGLDINNYGYSYSELHRLRDFALKVEKNKRMLNCMDYGKVENCGECVYCQLNGKLTIEERKKVTRFYEFIDHSDCEYGYLSFKKFGIKELPKDKIGLWGDLDELKREVRVLNKHIDKLDINDRNAWEDFYDDVMEADEILNFN